MAMKNITASAAIKAEECNVYGIIITSNGNAAGDTVAIADKASAGGTAILSFIVGAVDTDPVIVFCPSVGMHFDNGCYVTITDTGTTNVSVLYD